MKWPIARGMVGLAPNVIHKWRAVCLVLVVFGWFGSLAVADTISHPVSVAIPTGMEGELSSKPVSVAIPTGMEGELSSKPVSVAIPSGFEGQLLSRPVTVTVQPANVGDPDLVGLWHMDGDWADSSGMGNDLTGLNGVSFSSDSKLGSASGSFNRGSSYLRRASGNGLPLGNSPRTFLAWIKPFSYPTTTYNGIIAYGLMVNGNKGSLLSIKNDGRLSMAFWYNDALQTDGPAVTLNEWNQVAFTYEGGTSVKFYVNGQFAQECTLSANTPANTQNGPLRIGSTDDPGRVFNGLIDEAAIYKRALTAEEIQGMYNKAALESKPPAKPVVTDPPSLIASSPITLAGTKEADTSLWLNGRKQVDLGPETEWQAEASLEYGPNLISLVTKNEYGIDSDPVILTVTMDDVAPEVISTSPAEGSLTNNRNLDVSFRLGDEYAPLDLNASIAKASVIDSLGNPIAGTWSVTGTETVAFSPGTPLGDGSYVATVHPTDSLGNMTVANLTFTVDGTAPPVPGIDPIDGPVSSIATVSGTFSSDASEIVVSSSGGSVGTVTYPTATSWQVKLSDLPEGETVVSAIARDAAGNSSEAVSIALDVDTTPPAAPTVDNVVSPINATKITLSGGKEMETRLFINSLEVTESLDVVSDEFAGTDGDLPNVNLWRVEGSPNTVEVVDNKLNINYLSDSVRVNTSAISEFVLSGDFDIQVDYSIQDDLNKSYWNAILSVYNAEDFNQWGGVKVLSDDKYALRYDDNISRDSSIFNSRSNSEGKLRLVRSENKLIGYFSDGSSTNKWNKIGEATWLSNDVVVKLNIWRNFSGYQQRLFYDNFEVNYAEKILLRV